MTKRYGKATIFLAIVLTLVSCNDAPGPMSTHSPSLTVSVIPDTPTPSPAPTETIQPQDFYISREDALADYDYLWAALEENYPYYELVQTDPYGPKLNLRNIIETYRERICKHESISADDFYNIITESLAQFNIIGHLNTMNRDYYDTMRNIYSFELNDFRNNRSEEIQVINLLESLLNEFEHPKAIKFYSELSSSHSSFLEETEAATEEDLLLKVESTIETWRDNEIAYIKIKTFAWPHPECKDIAIELLNGLCYEYRHADNIIIDIQCNGGGNTTVWMDGIIKPLWQHPIESSYLLGAKSGELNRIYWGNEYPPGGTVYSSEDVEWKSYFPNLEADRVKFFDYLKIDRTSIDCSDSAVGFNGKVWLLVDRYTYSAAEALAIFCKNSGFATIVGERTRGSGMGSDPYILILPNTGLLIIYEGFCGINPDGTYNGIIGTAPDIVVEDGQSVLERCLTYIRCVLYPQ